MKTYAMPTVIEYGKSSELIKGECGWGNENAWLDQTGAKKYNVRRWVWVQGYPYDYRVCSTVSVCSTSTPSNEC